MAYVDILIMVNIIHRRRKVGEIIMNNKCKSVVETILSEGSATTYSVQFKHCHLQTIPKSIYRYIFLEYVDLSYNNLYDVTPLNSCNFIRYLNLSCNSLSTLNNLNLCSFVALESLDISHNLLTTIPTELINSKKLASLNISYNRLTKFPTFSESSKTTLKILNLSNNWIRTIDEDVVNLSNLHILDISFNYVEKLNLKIYTMRKLNEIIFVGNPLVQPPIKICIKGLLHIFKYMEKLHHKAQSVNDKVELKNVVKISVNEPIKNDLISQQQKPDYNFTGGSIIDHALKIINVSLKKHLSKENLHHELSDGIILCELLNYYRPATIKMIQYSNTMDGKRIHEKNNPLTSSKKLLNVQNFYYALKALNIDDRLLCKPLDIISKQNIVLISKTIVEISKKFTIKV